MSKNLTANKGEYQGLTSDEALKNLETYGYNTDIVTDEPRKFKFYGVFKHLRLYLMLGSAFLYLISDNIASGVLLLLLTLGYCVFEVLMETHCGQKLSQLTENTGVAVRVVRDGKLTLIERSDIAQDDLIVLQGGESVPADAHIIAASKVTVDESVFTKSKIPVNKTIGADCKHELKTTCVYKGTKILTGALSARVYAIGEDVKIRPKAKTVREVHRTKFEELINRISTPLTYIAAVVLVVVSVLRFILVSPALLEPEEELSLLTQLVSILLPAVSFALCVVPISLSLVVRVYYANAAVELSEKYGEIKNLRALEKLNSVSVLCLENPTIVDSDNTPLVAEISDNKTMLSRIAALSCSVEAHNSYERAIYVASAFNKIDVKKLQENELVQRYAPEKDEDYNKMHGNMWEIKDSRLVCIKGEPEVIWSYCRLTVEKLNQLQEQYSKLSKAGHHVLAVAFAQIKKSRKGYDEENDEYYYEYAEHFKDDEDYNENDFNFEVPENIWELEFNYSGLLAFSINVRDQIMPAIVNCERAGIRTVMFTPSNKEIAITVATKIGITSGRIVTGVELLEAKSSGRVLRLSDVSVFAGVSDEQKEEVIKTLKKNGEKTVLFAENDNANILELADVRVALSRHTASGEWSVHSSHTTGTNAQICDLIMESPHEDGDGLVKTSETIREARQVHYNIKRCIALGTSTFVALLLFGLMNLFIGSGFVLEAVFASILLVLIVPALTLSFVKNKFDDRERYNHNEKTRPSNFIKSGEISREFFVGTAIQCGILLATLLIMFFIFSAVFRADASLVAEAGVVASVSEEAINVSDYIGKLRSVFLTVFTAAGVAMAWVGLSAHESFYRSLQPSSKNTDKRSRWQENPVILISLGAFVFNLLSVYLPFVNVAFGMESINPFFFLICVIVGGVSQIGFEFVKRKYL
ncbi:MAG: cation-translocating P-type ATPase [Oscillospiraceae bacterium]|nr:cation-translocating P-type ATPase [Oscillospiraceae bacterium]